jgi:hypothetical protein
MKLVSFVLCFFSTGLSSIAWILDGIWQKLSLLTLFDPYSASGYACVPSAILAAVALIWSILAVLRCDIITTSTYPGRDSVGLFLWKEGDGKCRKFDEYTELIGFDPISKPVQVARAMGILAVSVGSLVMLSFVVAAFRKLHNCHFISIGLLSIINSCFQGLVFLIQQMNICGMWGCDISTGGRVVMTACALWAVSGIVCIGQHAKPRVICCAKKSGEISNE